MSTDGIAPKGKKGTNTAILTRESALSSDRFSGRLQAAKGNETVPHLAIRTGISKTVLYGYIKGENEPTRPALIRLARALCVNLEWLATGEGPMKTGPQVTYEHATYTAPARDSVDLERLEEAIMKVEQFLEERRVTRPPEVRAQLIAYFYDRSLRKERVEKNDLVGLLDLIY